VTSPTGNLWARFPFAEVCRLVGWHLGVFTIDRPSRPAFSSVGNSHLEMGGSWEGTYMGLWLNVVATCFSLLGMTFVSCCPVYYIPILLRIARGGGLTLPQSVSGVVIPILFRHGSLLHDIPNWKECFRRLSCYYSVPSMMATSAPMLDPERQGPHSSLPPFCQRCLMS
jgi:hypothetical protein